jgi:hypothetical protein
MRAATVSISLFALVAACGARTPIDLGGTTSSGDDDADASVPDAGVDSSLPANVPIHLGYVGAIGTTGAGADGTFAFARFYPEPVDPACGYLGAVGTCVVVTCFDGGDAPLSDDAGLINAMVTPSGDGTLLPYDGASPTGMYPTATFMLASDGDPGTEFDFVGRGAVDVPAFDVDVTMPDAATLLSPVVQVSTTIDTSTDLSVTWGGISSGDAVFALAPEASTNTSPTLICFFDGSTGHGVVPRADLAQIKAASPGGEAQLSFFGMARASTTAGAWTVAAIAVDETGSGAQSGVVTLE